MTNIHYTCSRCKQDVKLSEMDKNQKDIFFQTGFCLDCQDTLPNARKY